MSCRRLQNFVLLELPVPQRSPTDALRGSLHLLLLQTPSFAPMREWGISRRVQQSAEGVRDVNQGSLHPALRRLEKDGLIASEWGTTGDDRKAHYSRPAAVWSPR